MTPFTAPTANLMIGSLEPGYASLGVIAQYNPKELQIEKPVPWTEKGASLHFDRPGLRTTTVELLFDGYEHATSVQAPIDVLEKLSTAQDLTDRFEARRRPHWCVATWGQAGIPPLRCVIESLTTKYTVFGRDGTPLRAVCTVKLKEVDFTYEEKQAPFGTRRPSSRR